MTTKLSSPIVLVTGAGGFIALHCVRQLLEQGYRVRGTLRSVAREAQLRQALVEYVDAGDRLEFVSTDLLNDKGWAEAVQGCEYVLHVASPYPLSQPADERDLIRPAVDGTLRVLNAAIAAGHQPS